MKVTVLIGHNKDSQGAVTPEGVTEWRYNSAIAEIMWLKSRHISGLDLRVFKRFWRDSKILEIRNAYEEINKWDPDVIIELHFNGDDGPQANGTEMLFWGDSEKGRKLALILKNWVFGYFGTTRRAEKPIYHKRQRGYYNLKFGKAPTVICEPFFGSNPEREKFIPHPGKLADAYLNAVMEYFGG